MDEDAKKNGVGVIAAGNFLVTAVLLKRFALEAARYLNDIEIVEYASPGKKTRRLGRHWNLLMRLPRFVPRPVPASRSPD